MSPEIVKKINYNENVDIWSLGILLYEMVHGVTPFYADEISDIYNKIIKSDLSKLYLLKVLDKFLNQELKYLLQNILNKSPEKRFNIIQII